MPALPRPLVVHAPERPTWDCAGCRAPWPCDCARTALLIHYANDPIALGVHLCTTMHRAIDDFVHHGWPLRPSTIHTRFLAWADNPPLTHNPTPH